MRNSKEINSVPFAYWRKPENSDLEDLTFDFSSNGLPVRIVFGFKSGNEAQIDGFDCTANFLIGFHKAQLHFKSKQCEMILSKAVPGAFLKFDGNPRDLLFLNHLVTPALDALERFGLGTASITSLSLAPVESSEIERLEVIKFEDEAGSVQGIAALSGDDGFFAALELALRHDVTKKAKLNNRVNSLRSDIALVAGIVRLSLFDFKRLRVGQGIFLDVAPIEENALFVSLDNQQYFSARILGNSAQITSGAFLKMPNDAEKMNPFSDLGSVQPFPGIAPGLNNQNQAGGFLPNPLRADNLVAVEDIPLQVTVEIARYELTIDEISSLSAGSMFDIPENPKKFVTLRVGNQILGHGEIVQAGHKLAVRITEMKI